MRVAGVTFNLETITGEEMADFFDAARKNDIRGVSAGLALVIDACPAEWGNPRDPKTYLKQSYFKVLEPLVLDLADERAGKN